MRNPGKGDVMTIRYFLCACLVGLLALTPAIAAQTAPGRAALSLDGEWEFQLDREKNGEAAGWNAGDQAFSGRIQVPGAWDAQGFGDETDKLRHQFIGTGWYRRVLDVPADWEGQRLFLCIANVHRYAKTWVNGAYLGEHIGYLSPFEYEITGHVSPGQPAHIVIAVDSDQRWDLDCLAGCIDFMDEMDAPWGGFWGHIGLEARSRAWLEDPFVQSDATGTVRVTARIAGEPREGDAAQVILRDAAGATVAELAGGTVRIERGFLEGVTRVENAKRWSTDHPHLYTAELVLADASGALDQRTVRFGMRTLEPRGSQFYLNGAPFFLRGYGDDAIYPATMIPPADKAFYLERLKVIKSYGFNGVRHHSHFLPPEYYEACDEMGILVQPELPIVYLPFYQRAQGAALELYKTEWAAVITRLRNHPSVFGWCMGNELYDGIPLGEELYRIAKELDPQRMVIDSDGLLRKDWLSGERRRSTLDYYAFQFDVFNLPQDTPGLYDFPAEPPRPVISHETGNFGTFPLLDQIEQFEHNIKPFWFISAREKVAALDLLDEVPLWARNSQRLYSLCHKLNIEDIRKKPYISGHHWWLFQDYWTGSNGIVESYFRPKEHIKPEEVRQFINDVVLLEDGLAWTYRSGDALALSFLVSNYAEAPLADTSLACRIECAGQVLLEDTWTIPPPPQGAVTAVREFQMACPEVSEPSRLTITLQLRTPSRTVENAWTTWVYPLEIAPTFEHPVYASAEWSDELASFGVTPLPEDGALPAAAAYVASTLSRPLLQAARDGACLLLLKPDGVFSAVNNRFKTTWWLGNARDSNVGTVVYDNPVTAGMAPEGWCDGGWYRLLENASSYLLDDAPARSEVLVRGIDGHRFCRDRVLLFQMRVGKGSVVTCGLNLEQEEIPVPEKEWLTARLLDYAASRPQPAAEWPEAYFDERAMDTPPVTGPFIAGFASSSTEDQVQRYMSYREEHAPYHILRQTDTANRLEWTTAPVPEPFDSDHATFVFAGGLGWRTQPETPGFAFCVNGKRILNFDITDQARQWQDSDSGISLVFMPRRRLPEDTAGIFFVVVPAQHLTPAAPCTFAVESLGTGSMRWFGLNLYTRVPPAK
jgi:beta-galactosidase